MRLVGGLTDIQQKRLDQDLFEHARNGDVEEVKKVILFGADVNAFDEGQAWKLPKDKFFSSPLIAAIEHGHAVVVQELVSRGADVNRRLSPKLGKLEKSLYENEYHYQTGQGMYNNLRYATPLMIAVEREAEFHDTENTLRVLRILLRHGARLNDSMLGRVTALDVAVDNHLWDCADVLISYDPFPSGRTPKEVDELIRRIRFWKKYGS